MKIIRAMHDGRLSLHLEALFHLTHKTGRRWYSSGMVHVLGSPWLALQPQLARLPAGKFAIAPSRLSCSDANCAHHLFLPAFRPTAPHCTTASLFFRSSPSRRRVVFSTLCLLIFLQVTRCTVTSRGCTSTTRYSTDPLC